MAKKTKKMSTGKKVAIGVGVAAVVGAILCYFYCPCFKKSTGMPLPGAGTQAGSTPLVTGSGFSVGTQTPMGAASVQKLTSFASGQMAVQKAGSPEQIVPVW